MPSPSPSFPRVPAALEPCLPAGAVRLRRFGLAASDLDVDFAASRPVVVDAVLAACVEPAGVRGALAELPISVRLRALLRLAAVEAPVAALVFACDAPGCAASLELALPLEAVAADPPQVVTEVAVGGRRLRVPTGVDARRLAEHGASGAGEVPTRIALANALLVAGDPVGEADLPAVERALAGADPLVEFFVTTTCPDCGRALARDVDLEALALDRLARVQAALVLAVHRLARAYHWSERDVLALPARRRDQYLALIQEAER